MYPGVSVLLHRCATSEQRRVCSVIYLRGTKPFWSGWSLVMAQGAKRALIKLVYILQSVFMEEMGR